MTHDFRQPAASLAEDADVPVACAGIHPVTFLGVLLAGGLMWMVIIWGAASAAGYVHYWRACAELGAEACAARTMP